MKFSRRAVIGLTLASLLLATVAVLVNHDEAQPETTDLEPRKRTLEPDQNAYFLLQKLAADFRSFPKDKSWNEAADRALYEEPLGESDAAVLLLNTQPFIWRLLEISSLPPGEALLPATCIDFNPNTGEIMTLWRLAVIHAKRTARQGDPAEAIRQLTVLLKGTRHFSDAGGPLIDYLAGTALRNLTIAAARDIQRAAPLQTGEIRNLILIIEAARPSSAGLIESFRAEFDFSRMVVKELPANFHQWETMSVSPQKAPWLAHWFFKPNKTLRLTAERQRQAIRQIDLPYESLPQEPTEDFILTGRLPHPDNALGRYMIAMNVPVYREILKGRLRDQSNISLTTAWLAADLYERETGHLPATLDELIPHYLHAIPRDYYTGAPISYSTELRAVWSAGADAFAFTRLDQEVPERTLILRFDKLPPR